MGAQGQTIQPALDAVTAQTGATYNCIELFANADPGWPDWVHPYVLDDEYVPWTQADPSRTVVLTIDLVPNAVIPTAPWQSGFDPYLEWEQSCAQGDYNGYAAQLAQNLVSAGWGNIFIRLGDEANGPWEWDFMGNTKADQRAWARCFDQEVATMRSVPGANFQFVWNPNACVQANGGPWRNWYPGNQYVDIIGIDQYDALCDGNSEPIGPSTIGDLFSEAAGMNSITQFAEQQKKPLALPEWGCTSTTTAFEGPVAGGEGNDPFYIREIGKWISQNHVVFQSYFDNSDDGILPLTSTAAPLALQAYRDVFG